MVRDRLVGAARRVFERRGFRGLTLADIAAESGEEAATVQAAFATVGDAMCRVFDSVATDVGPIYSMLGDALAAPDLAAMTTWVDRFLDWWVENEAILHALREASVFDHRVACYVMRQRDAILEQVDTPFEGYSAERRLNAERTLRVLLDQLGQSGFDWYTQGADPAARRQLVAEQAQLWRTLLAAF